MFNWLKKLFGFDVPDTPVIAQESKKEVQSHVSKVVKVEQAEVPAKPKKQAKKPAAKLAKVDLDSMKKADLLALAKEKGIKANASLSKGELVDRINAG